MGMSMFGSRSSSDNLTQLQDYYNKPQATGEPIPDQFNIIKMEQIGKHVVVMVHYPNCFNFEGRKIMLYRNVSSEEVSTCKKLDPHFSEMSRLSPFARFEPTEFGWEYAIECARKIP